jgi:hypothetical protein
MLESRPSSSPGTTFGFILIASLILLDFGLLFLLLNEPVTMLSFLWGSLLFISLPTMAFIAYWTSGLISPHYRVVGPALLIEWGHSCQVIPLKSIRSLVRGATLAEVRQFRGARWPGCFVGWGQVSAAGREAEGPISYPTIFFATRPLSQQLLLVTDSIAYAISPVDLENFGDCLEALRHSTPEAPADTPVSQLGPLEWPIWQDRPAQVVLVMTTILNALLFAGLCLSYGRLPALVPLHFNQAGIVNRMGAPANLFILPLIGLFAWLVNGALGYFFYQRRQERPLALILWGSSLIVQVIAWATVLGLTA